MALQQEWNGRHQRGMESPFFGSGKYLNEMDFTMNGFSQKIYLMAVNKIENEVKLQCARYFTTGRVDEQNSKIDKVAFTFSATATTADL